MTEETNKDQEQRSSIPWHHLEEIAADKVLVEFEGGAISVFCAFVDVN
jgi:hypothetical protein